jgi:hypothetical protein
MAEPREPTSNYRPEEAHNKPPVKKKPRRPKQPA